MRDHDVRELPAYGVAEAAHYLLVPRATLRSWDAGRDFSQSASENSTNGWAAGSAFHREDFARRKHHLTRFLSGNLMLDALLNLPAVAGECSLLAKDFGVRRLNTTPSQTALD